MLTTTPPSHPIHHHLSNMTNKWMLIITEKIHLVLIILVAVLIYTNQVTKLQLIRPAAHRIQRLQTRRSHFPGSSWSGATLSIWWHTSRRRHQSLAPAFGIVRCTVCHANAACHQSPWVTVPSQLPAVESGTICRTRSPLPHAACFLQPSKDIPVSTFLPSRLDTFYLRPPVV